MKSKNSKRPPSDTWLVLEPFTATFLADATEAEMHTGDVIEGPVVLDRESIEFSYHHRRLECLADTFVLSTDESEPGLTGPALFLVPVSVPETPARCASPIPVGWKEFASATLAVFTDGSRRQLTTTRARLESSAAMLRDSRRLIERSRERLAHSRACLAVPPLPISF